MMYKVVALIFALAIGYWVEAKDLREGDVFLGANGELSTLVAAERVVFPDGIKVYNFTVDGNHNYFVIAKCDEYGQTSILVHNAGGVYGLRDPNTGEIVRTGRTNDFPRRAREHGRDPELNKYEFKQLFPADVYAEQRGLEQFAHELHNPRLNKINPISPTNPNKPAYTKAADTYRGLH